MLQLESLKIKNYGPYYGEHTIKFKQQDGVSIIWGENGLGKTSIMNCFRFVMWGEIRKRNEVAKELCSYVNKKAVKEGEDMSITLHMRYDGSSYKITRTLQRKSGDGTHDSDYSLSKYTLKDESALSSEQFDHFLSTSFPPKVARFYLFDAELLNEYETLLEPDENSMVIKESIENILGMPILENCHNIIDSIYRKENDEVIKIAQKESKSKNVAQYLQAAIEELSAYEKKYEVLNEQYKQYLQERAKTEQEMKSSERYRELLVNIKTKKDLLERLDKEVTDTTLLIKDQLDKIWKVPLDAVVKDLIEKKRKEIEPLSLKKSNTKKMMAIQDYIKQKLSLQPCNCPICKQNLTTESQNAIKSSLSEVSLDEVMSSDEDKRLDLLNNEIKELDGFISHVNMEMLKKVLGQLKEKEGQIGLLHVEIDKMTKERGDTKSDLSEDYVMNLSTQYANVCNKIANQKQSMDENVKMQKELEVKIEHQQKMVDSSLSKKSQEKRERRDFTESIKKLFSDALVEFKVRLKDSVENDATEIFKKISHAQNYSHLQINDNFGLQIIDNNGQIVPNRSSGYEQVVAISLIGSLHKNTPIEGPIFMDSTFQRIDQRHKENVISALPDLSSQVIVLAVPEEFNRQKAIELLGDKLVEEWEIVVDGDYNRQINKYIGE